MSNIALKAPIGSAYFSQYGEKLHRPIQVTRKIRREAGGTFRSEICYRLSKRALTDMYFKYFLLLLLPGLLQFLYDLRDYRLVIVNVGFICLPGGNQNAETTVYA